MSSPESSRRNLEHARMLGRVKFWRSRSESQRVKAEIVVLHYTNAGLSQRVIARTFRVSQPYVARLLKRVNALGIAKALGAEAYERYREVMEVKRREHFLAVGGPASLTAETPSYPRPTWAFHQGFEEPQSAEPLSCTSAVVEKVDETQYVELGRSTTEAVIEMHGSKPIRTAPVYAPRPAQPLTTKEIAAMGPGLSVADQCPSFGKR